LPVHFHPDRPAQPRLLRPDRGWLVVERENIAVEETRGHQHERNAERDELST